MASFFSRLSYSFGNEDSSSDHKALNIQKEDHVICITASGDRPLNLLSKDLKKLTTLDLNPSQNHLLALKIAATQQLNYSDFLSFMGLEECSYRKELFTHLSSYLEHETFLFFRKRLPMIKKGIIYQGATEKACRLLSSILRLFKTGRQVEELFACKDLHEQRAFLEQQWNQRFWMKTFNRALSPLVTRVVIQDPGLYDYLGPRITPGTYIYERFMKVLGHSLARKNPLISLMFQGKVAKEGFPPCLTKEGIDLIKPRLNRISIEKTDVLTYLEKAPSESIDCFSLSDVISYLKPNDRDRLIKAMIRTAKPGARFCLRQFLSHYELPPALAKHVIRNEALEQQIEAEDHTFIYRFIVGHIKK